MKHRLGRPPLDDEEPSVPVHLKMTASQYDEYYRRAILERISIPEVIRRDLRAGREKERLK